MSIKQLQYIQQKNIIFYQRDNVGVFLFTFD